MHFWIDKRSCGIGHNRLGGMTGISSWNQQQHRRINNSIGRSKSIVIPQIAIRPYPTPSTSHQHAKSHHHRNRHAESDRPNGTRIQQHSTTESSLQAPNIPMHLNQQHSIVIHSVYPRDQLLISAAEPSESNRNGNVINHWLPIQIICGICIIAVAITLIIFYLSYNLYFDNEMTGLQLLSFLSVSIAFLLFSALSCTFCSKTWLKSQLRIQHNEIFTETVIEPMDNQTTMQSHFSTSLLVEPPPPYNLAISFKVPEKQSTANINLSSTPPPSYEKINRVF